MEFAVYPGGTGGLSGPSPYQTERLLRLQKIEQELLADLGHNGFRVELDPLDGITAVAQAHDLSLSGFGGDLQLWRQAFPSYDQRMIASRFKWIWQGPENAVSLVHNR